MTDFGILGDAFEQAMEVGQSTVKRAAGEPSKMVKVAANAITAQQPSSPDKNADLRREEQEKKQRDQQKINEIQGRLAALKQQQKQAQKVIGEERQRIAKVQEEIMKGTPEEQKKRAAEQEEEFKPPASKATRGLPFDQKSQTEKNRTVSG